MIVQSGRAVGSSSHFHDVLDKHNADAAGCLALSPIANRQSKIQNENPWAVGPVASSVSELRV